MYTCETSYMSVYDREQIINRIINACEQLKWEYKLGQSKSSRAWENHLINFEFPNLLAMQQLDLQERRVADIFSPRYPNDYIEETKVEYVSS